MLGRAETFGKSNTPCCISEAGQKAGAEAFGQIRLTEKNLKIINTKHGEFGKKCAEAFGENCLTETDLERANTKAAKYMRLAQHRNDWLPHNPQSMNEAISLPVSAEIPSVNPSSQTL